MISFIVVLVGSAFVMPPDSRTPDGHNPESRLRRPDPELRRLSPSAPEPSIATGSTLGRIYQSLADFTVLTRFLREAVDDRLAVHLTVTGWQSGELRVLLDQPALATRWRFQEPGVRRALARKPELAGLKGIRLVMTDIGLRGPARPPADPVSLRAAPIEALQEMAEMEDHAGLRNALIRLSEAAARAREKSTAGK